MLNVLQRLSGIATLTRKFVDAIQGTSTRILDTRKTVPGLRVLDKYAVRCGGGQNHRLDLSDGVLIKNNHIALAGGVALAQGRAALASVAWSACSGRSNSARGPRRFAGHLDEG